MEGGRDQVKDKEKGECLRLASANDFVADHAHDSLFFLRQTVRSREFNTSCSERATS